MLEIIKTLDHPLLSLIKDDPVRPEISVQDRISKNKEVLVLIEDNTPSAVVCVSYQSSVPKTTEDLCEENNPNIVIFYTIWSYKKEAGKRLLFQAKEYIKEHNTNIKRFITLSPKTDIARKFHMSNGAIELRVNKDSVNYEYGVI